ncbi:alanine racemase, partial [Thioclava sp. BHET1]
MSMLKARLEGAGIAVPQISIGSTPTVLLNAGFEGVTEIRPGNYALLDRTQVALGAAEPDEIALTVIASVISINDQFAIIDAGSKVLSSDLGAHGASKNVGYGQALRLKAPAEAPFIVSRLSEEHGFVPLEGRKLELGEKLQILPNHACPVMNRANGFALRQT